MGKKKKERTETEEKGLDIYPTRAPQGDGHLGFPHC